MLGRENKDMYVRRWRKEGQSTAAMPLKSFAEWVMRIFMVTWRRKYTREVSICAEDMYSKSQTWVWEGWINNFLYTMSIGKRTQGVVYRKEEGQFLVCMIYTRINMYVTPAGILCILIQILLRARWRGRRKKKQKAKEKGGEDRERETVRHTELSNEKGNREGRPWCW